MKPLPRTITPDHVRAQLAKDEEYEQKQEAIANYLDQHPMTEIFQIVYPNDWLEYIDEILLHLTCEDTKHAETLTNNTVAKAMQIEQAYQNSCAVDAQIETLTYG